MRAAVNAIIPWVAVTLLLRYLVDFEGWPVGLTGTLSRAVTLPLLAAWVVGTGRGWRRLVPDGKGGRLAVMGLISIALNLLWFGALKWTPATNVSMLIRLDVVFVTLIGAGLGLERITRTQIVLLPVMLVGLGLLTEVYKFDFGGHLVGDSMVVLAAFGLAVNAFIIRGILEAMDETAVALYNHGISTLGFVAVGLLNHEFARTGEMLGQGSAWVAVVALGAILAVQLPLYYVALAQMEIWKLRTYLLLTPVVTALAEWLLWETRLSPWQCLGGGIILAGLAVMIRLEARESAGRASNPVLKGMDRTEERTLSREDRS